MSALPPLSDNVAVLLPLVVAIDATICRLSFTALACPPCSILFDMSKR